MAKLLFGSSAKVMSWILIVIFFFCGFQIPFCFLIALAGLLIGPSVAIPAMVARYGKHVESTKSLSELKQIITSTFAQKKTTKNWTIVSQGLGQMNFKLTSTKRGREPVVSVELEDSGEGSILVHIWMSEWTSGGLNGGKGTPFWVWGGSRAASKVSEVANAVA